MCFCVSSLPPPKGSSHGSGVPRRCELVCLVFTGSDTAELKTIGNSAQHIWQEALKELKLLLLLPTTMSIMIVMMTKMMMMVRCPSLCSCPPGQLDLGISVRPPSHRMQESSLVPSSLYPGRAESQKLSTQEGSSGPWAAEATLPSGCQVTASLSFTNTGSDPLFTGPSYLLRSEACVCRASLSKQQRTLGNKY